MQINDKARGRYGGTFRFDLEVLFSLFLTTTSMLVRAKLFVRKCKIEFKERKTCYWQPWVCMKPGIERIEAELV